MPAAPALSFRWSGSELEGQGFTPGLRDIGRMKKRKSVCVWVGKHSYYYF